MNSETAKWAEEKNRALRRALNDVSAACAAIRKAEASMKKALSSVKSYQEASDAHLVLIGIVEARERMEGFDRMIADRANSLWSDVLEFKEGMKNGQSSG